MKYPGDIIYFFKFVGLDVLIIAGSVLIIAIAAAWHFLRGKKSRKNIDQE